MSFNFNNKYEQKDFLRFLRNDFLKDFFDEKIEQTSINNKIFNKITKLWVCEKLNNLIVLEIEHNSKNDARITITKELFKLLKQYDLNGETYKNALVIFINKESSQYRFSLLTTTYNEDYEEKLSNPKRFSFLLWPNEKVKTVKEFLEKKWSIENFDDLVKRFDVEIVRKEFFNNYLDLYIRLYREIIKDEEFAKNLKTQNIDLVSFTKTLLWKIIFLYFIQKKGWLWVEKDGEYWKNWDKDFMRNLWNDFKNNTEKTVWEKTWFFYNDYLEHLFYEWLNKDNRQEKDLNNYFNFKVPYLNWGLFKKDYENWNTNRARISNEIFSNSKQTGILDVFDTYNFTIDEDDLYDKEVAIDPEMLWKIFEKMISISEENIWKILEEFNKNEESWKKAKLEIDNVLNKKLGAFYTPREIVHYMTKESLIAYLVNNLKWKKEENETKIRKVFDYKEKFLTIHEVNLEKEFNEVWEIIEDVIDKLDKIKILDPAIWSWAFPMGLLHEIYTLKYYIFDVFYREFDMLWNEEVKEFVLEDEKISVYKIKKKIIQDNIYWVDISPWAIDIARLRFWLSLVVDEETPEPLPNFEFKFVCANTLIPLDDSNNQLSLEKEINIDTLKNYMSKYYNAQKNTEKEDWKRRIENLLWIWKLSLEIEDLKSNRKKQLQSYEPFNPNHSAEFFDPSLMMWNSKFDIVIGNPPYVSVKWIENKEKEKFQKLYESWNWRFNLFNLFIEKWIKSLSKWWILSFIIPDWICSHTEYRHNRKFIIDNSNIIYINTFWKQVFENASVDTIVLSLQKTEYKLNNIKILNDLKETWNYINQNSILEMPDLLFPVNLNKTNSSIILKWLNIKTKFQDFLEIQQWIIYTWQTKEEVFSNLKLNESYKKVLDWRDILKWKNNYSEKLENKYICYSNKLHRAREERIYLSDKIIFPRRSNIIAWTIDKEQFYALNTVYIGILKNDILKLEYILAILNSKFNNFFYSNLFLWWQITIPALDFLPIPKISSESQKPFIEKVDKILEITKPAFYDPKNPPKEQKDLEDEIDKMVYELYGLSDEEVRVVEESLV